MDTVVTNKTDSHHTNQNYQCLLVNLLRDPRFHFKIVGGYLAKADWMPLDSDVIELCEHMIELSPTFREQLLSLAMSIPMPITRSSRPNRVITGKSNLAELLL